MIVGRRSPRRAGVTHIADDISISDDSAAPGVAAIAGVLAGRASFAAGLLGEQIEAGHHAAHLAAIFFHLHPTAISEAGLAGITRRRAGRATVALAEESGALNRRQTGGWHGRLGLILGWWYLAGRSQHRQVRVAERQLLSMERSGLIGNSVVTANSLGFVMGAMQLATDQTGGKRDACRCQQASAK